MKSVALLSMAACASAVSLRGEGVEEVGEQIEHFPPEDYGWQVERRILHVDEEAAEHDEEVDMANRMMEEYFAEDETFGEDEEYYEDEDPNFDPDSVDIMGYEVEHSDDLEWQYWEEGEEPPEDKEYSPDPDSITVSLFSPWQCRQ